MRVLSRYFGIRENARLPKTQNNVGARRVTASRKECRRLQRIPDGTRCPRVPPAKSALQRLPAAERMRSKEGWKQNRLPNLGNRRPQKISRAAPSSAKNSSLLLCCDKSKTPRGFVALAICQIQQRENAATIEQRFSDQLNLVVKLQKLTVTVRHSVTRYRITLMAWETLDAQNHSLLPSRNGVEWRWCNAQALNRITVDAATKRFCNACNSPIHSLSPLTFLALRR